MRVIGRISCWGAFLLLLILVTGQVQAAFKVVEDFEGLNPGNINGQNGWTAPGSSGLVVADPVDPTNTVLAVTTDSTYLYKPLAISNETVRMLFFRFRIANQLISSFGMSDSAVPDQFGDFESELSIRNSPVDLRINDDGSYENLATLATDTWYNVWMLIDNQADTTTVWLNDIAGGQAIATDILANESGQTVFRFRSGGTPRDLINFFIKTGGGNSQNSGPLYIDDLYLENSNVVNFWNPTSTVLEKCEGDLDLDGDVDGFDIDKMNTSSLTGSRYNAARDFDRNGLINAADFAIFAADYGRSDCPLTPHAGIVEYRGPATCIGCHRTEAGDMFGSVHYQWTGPTPNVGNIDGDAGKGHLGFNTYCGTTESSRRSACWSCHVGYGSTPSAKTSGTQLQNIDCLMCHSARYKRKPAGPFETVSYTDYTGETRSWQLPKEDDEGNYRLEPNEEAMGIDIVEIAQTVHHATRESCLRCHAYAAGSDCGKRGDLSSATASPPARFDVHMSTAGQDFVCQNCHRTDKHRTMGRGLDIRPNDRQERLTCTISGCHSNSPHDEDEDEDTEDSKLNQHTARVACQSCHIPTFAKLKSTEVDRDWGAPYFAQGLFNGQGGFKPEEIRESNIIPTYRWFDGTSNVYARGQIPPLQSGVYEMGAPNGNVTSADAKLYPMKEHFSQSAMHDATGQLIPHSTFTYFVTGDFDRAVADGQNFAGLFGSWTLVDVHTYQTINHGVEPEEHALDCGQCHPAFSDGDSVRMDLKGKLGYALKASPDQLCVQCHEDKGSKGFKKDHEKHVDDKGFGCSWCHGFTRPERDLRRP